MREFVLNINGKEITAPGGVPQPGTGVLDKIISGLFTYLIIAAILLALCYLIWGAINYILSRGDKEKRRTAKSQITFAIVGLIVVFLSFLIVNLLGGIFNQGFSVGR